MKTLSIPKRMAECASCRKEFIPQQEIVSELSEQNQGWERKDMCVGCYAPSESTVVWKHQIPLAPSLIAGQKEHFEQAWELLQSLLSKDTKEEMEEAFILTLYLARKKILLQKGKTSLYEHAMTQEMVMIPDVSLDSLSVPAIQERLQAKLTLVEVN